MQTRRSSAALAHKSLLSGEEPTCVASVFLRSRFYVAVGTAQLDKNADTGLYGEGLVSAKAGRMLLLEPIAEGGEWVLREMAMTRTEGAVYDVAVIHGFLAVAAGTKVRSSIVCCPTDPQVTLSTLTYTSSSGYNLVEVSTFVSAFVPEHLSIAPASKSCPDDRLVVGDGMRSIFVLDINEGSGRIEGEQKDLVTHSVTAMGSIRDGGDGIVIADVG